MRIVQIGKYFDPVQGGIENNTKQMAQQAAAIGQSTVVCMRRGKGPAQNSQVDGIDVHRLKSLGQIWRQEICESPARILQELDPDIVHFHGPNPLMTIQLCQAAQLLDGRKLVITHHADLFRPRPIRDIYLHYYFKLLDRADFVISYTRTFAESSRELERARQKMIFLPHGIDLPFEPPARRSVAHRSLNTVGFIGRIEKWKGLDTLLEALQEQTHLRAIIAGDGSYLSTLVARATDLGLSERIEFLGEVKGERKRDFFSSIDFFVLPSWTPAESYGQVLVEAQLCGVPLVASDLGTGINEICDHGRAGILVKPRDPDALAKALQKLQDPATHSMFAEAGQKHGQDNFHMKSVAQKIREFYTSLHNKTPEQSS